MAVQDYLDVSEISNAVRRDPTWNGSDCDLFVFRMASLPLVHDLKSCRGNPHGLR